MKNKERQKVLDKKKWLDSQKIGFDLSGHLKQCAFCPYRNETHCTASQAEREAQSLCATGYNIFYRKYKEAN